MKPKLLSTLAGLVAAPLLLLSSFGASAGMITETEAQTQITDGQNFNFSLDAPGYVPGTASLLSVTVQGDFNGAEETLAVSIEGVNQGTFSHDSSIAYDVIALGRPGNSNTFQFSLDFVLDSLLTGSLLADDLLDVAINFSGGTFGVHEQYGWSSSVNGERSGTAPFAAVSYSYTAASAANPSAIPEPSSIALLGLGLLAVGLRRKKLG